jgi:acyl carrier protein
VELREYLKRRLPEYMVPAAFVQLDELPLTPNGKLDRKALPAPEADALAHEAYEPPQGPVEQTLAGLWEELLGLTNIGRHDNFFELGGHSLLAVRLLSRLPEAFGLELPLTALFAHQTLGALAATIAEAPRQLQTLPRITPIERRGRVYRRAEKRRD